MEEGERGVVIEERKGRYEESKREKKLNHYHLKRKPKRNRTFMK
jgi:hypothetical protein